MTDELTLRRWFYAEALEAARNIRNRALVDALAAVPRERFLRPGPWLVHSEGDLGGPRPERNLVVFTLVVHPHA